MSTEAAKCQSCQHWLPLPTFPGKGECRRFPPQVFAKVYTHERDENRGHYESTVESTSDHEWPWTGADQWCGEWKKDEGE